MTVLGFVCFANKVAISIQFVLELNTACTDRVEIIGTHLLSGSQQKKWISPLHQVNPAVAIVHIVLFQANRICEKF